MKNLFSGINPKIVLIVILAFLFGWQLGHQDLNIRVEGYKPSVSVTNREVPKNVKVDFRLFWDTWDLLSQKYIDKKALEPNKLFYGAISGMVAAVGDPYTVFLPPEQQKSTTEELNGSFDGVGIQLGFNKDKRLVVVAPLDGTPAQRAGIKPQDMIVEINGKDTTGMNLPEAVQLIRGKNGTKVTLNIFREGEDDTRDFNLVRETIVVKSVEVSFKESPNGKKVAHIKLSRFGDRTKDEWMDVVTQINSQNPDAAILDVRNNPGGYLEGAVFISSEFLNGGDVVLQENNEGKRVPYKVDRNGKLLDIPLQVLINKGSASASEIVAGALQDRKRATLVGEKSFGKGTIQEAQELPGGTGLHVTIAKWLTPNGRWVNDTQGLEPDVKVELTEEQQQDSTQDPQLDKALELTD